MTNEELQAELERAQIMLAFVLATTGPVEVKKDALVAGLPPGATIALDQNPENDSVVLRLANESEFE